MSNNEYPPVPPQLPEEIPSSQRAEVYWKFADGMLFRELKQGWISGDQYGSALQQAAQTAADIASGKYDK